MVMAVASQRGHHAVLRSLLDAGAGALMVLDADATICGVQQPSVQQPSVQQPSVPSGTLTCQYLLGLTLSYSL